MFRPLEPSAAAMVPVTVAGRAMTLPEGANLAAALIAANAFPRRTTPVSGAERAPYCLMGVCYDCLVEIDGAPNRQACLETVRAGMAVAPQEGAA